MANYVANKIICTEEILNEYFIDFYPIYQDRKLEEPYITFNKLFGMKSLNEYEEKFGTNIYYGYGFSYKKNDKGMIEIKFLTSCLYPINAIVKAINMFKSDIVWYACEENMIFLSKFYWGGSDVQEDTLYLESGGYYEWSRNLPESFYKILSDYDFDIWYYDYETNKNWKNWKCDNLVERYLQEYPAQKYYEEIVYVG